MASFAQIPRLVYTAVLGLDSASGADHARLAFGALLWIVLVILNRGAAGASPRPSALEVGAGEDERVARAKHRCDRADVLAKHIAEELDRLGGVRLGRPGLEERLHVGCRAGHAEEAGLVVDEAFDRAGIESLVREQVHE